VPKEDILSLNAAVEAAGGEVVGADLMPLVLLESLAELERGGEPSIAVVLLPGSLSLFLRGGDGSVTACRHRTLDGGDTGEQGETEVMRGLVAWEEEQVGAQTAGPDRRGPAMRGRVCRIVSLRRSRFPSGSRGQEIVRQACGRTRTIHRVCCVSPCLRRSGR
jgi:hypothetical protein